VASVRNAPTTENLASKFSLDSQDKLGLGHDPDLVPVYGFIPIGYLELGQGAFLVGERITPRPRTSYIDIIG
jgi:hypothetical protein